MTAPKLLPHLVILAFCSCPALAADQPGVDDLDRQIEQHRKGRIQVQATAGTRVTVTQLRHEFWFGAALANSPFTGRLNPQDRAAYLEVFLTNFNSAVTENALKWHDMEPTRGNVNYRVVDATLAWCDEHQIPLRGHNIFWGITNRVQPWLKELGDEALREALRARALDIGKRYRGRFAEYDLNNEMIHGNYYAGRLGQTITRDMANWVKQADSAAVLYLNDYDILTGVRLEDYLRHIRELLDLQVPISGIGVQGHLHAEDFDPRAVHNALQKLSEFGLPIRITEFNMPGQRSRFLKDRSLRMTEAEEAAKARNLVEYYRICFSYPRVEGILMWGFWEGANWIPASSLFRRDWTPLPAAIAYHDLVYRKWWTRWEGKTGPDGKVTVPAFYGQYRVSSDTATQEVTLNRRDGQLTVRLP